MFKKSLSFILIIVIVLSMLSFTAFADDTFTSGYYTYKLVNNNAVITKCDKSISGNVIIPSTLDSHAVTGIEKYAFSGCKDITEITIPNCVTYIGFGVFRGCQSIAKITLPIVDLEVNYSYIGTLYGQTPESDNTYYSTKSLKEVKVLDGCKSLAKNAFAECVNIERIILPDSIETIGDGAFSQCTKLTDINIPKNLKAIGKNVFARCQAFEDIIIPDNIESIDYRAFDLCMNIKSVFIPSSVKSLDTLAFEACFNLEKITVDENNPVYYSKNNCVIEKETKSLIMGCKTSIIPDDEGILSIKDNAFKYTRGYSNITIPEGITKIGDGAFSMCAEIKSIYLPSTLKEIGISAFHWCNRLKTVYYNSTNSDWEKIKIGNDNDYLKNAKLMCICDIKGHVYDDEFDKECYVCSFKVTDKFKDINKNNFFYKNGAISFVYNKGLFKGVSENEFAPNSNMTRGSFVTVLGRFDGISPTKTETKFSDVSKSAYYSGYVKWASDNGIVNGFDGKFMPTDNVTREQICKMIVQYCKYKGINLDLTKNEKINFEDDNEISSYAVKYVDICQRAGIISGFNKDGKRYFSPKENATRAEVATILYNFYKNYIK